MPARFGLAVAVVSAAVAVLWLSPLRNVAPAQASTSSVQIVYPGDGNKLPYLTRSFVFGSAAPGSRVSVNGSPALVAPSGGWIAFVPFSPGVFHLRVVARRFGESRCAEQVGYLGAP